MSKKPQHADFALRMPLWMRVAALLCLFLIPVGSVAQACHNHNELLHTPNGPQHTSQNDCQLCIAMHSVLVVQQQQTPVPTGPVLLIDDAKASAPRIFLWRIELASRPPPAHSAAVAPVQMIAI